MMIVTLRVKDMIRATNSSKYWEMEQSGELSKYIDECQKRMEGAVNLAVGRAMEAAKGMPRGGGQEWVRLMEQTRATTCELMYREFLEEITMLWGNLDDLENG
ncbi:MAG: hypothetical protein ACR2PR_06160 [Pseudohongiellaceae bacterium]